MTLGWDRLRIVDAIARTGSVTHAAANLHMTGPAVSQQLRRIESEIGVKVVEPDGRGVRFTAKGKILAGYACQIAELMQRADNDLHRDDTYVDHLRVAAIASIIRAVLGPTLSSFWQSYPRVEVTVEDGETAGHLDRLKDGSLDLALAESWSASPLHIPAGVASQRIAREELYVALSADHPLASRSSVSLHDLVDERWATCAEGSDAHTALQQLARKHGVELKVSFFIADHLTQLSLVREGVAVACLPLPAGDQDRAVRYLRLESALHRDLLMLHSTGTHSLALQALVDAFTS